MQGFFRKSLCKRLCKSLKTLSSAGGRPSADPVVCRWRARFTPLGGVGSGRLRRAGSAGVHRREQRGKGTVWSPSPDSPKPSFAPRRPSVARRNVGYGGLGSVRRASFGRLLCPEFFLASTAAHDSARPSGAGRERRRCEKLRFDQGCALEQQTPLWAPRIWTRDRRSRVLRKVWGVKRERKPWLSFPSCPCRRAA